MRASAFCYSLASLYHFLCKGNQRWITETILTQVGHFARLCGELGKIAFSSHAANAVLIPRAIYHSQNPGILHLFLSLALVDLVLVDFKRSSQLASR